MDRIDLAHEPELRLGSLTIRPALRQIAHDGGAEEVVEPRVMQVLVALAREPGAILSRDDLTTSCWEGRVVGEDAINRVISRLRRVAEGIGEAAFRIETITKVGYRLIPGEGIAAPASGPIPAIDAELAAARDEARKLRLDRRAMLIGSGAAVVAAGGWWSYRRFTAPAAEPAPPADVAPLMFQASLMLQQGTPEGGSQAAGLLRRVVEKHPEYADGWGMLALTYIGGSNARTPEQSRTLRDRADEAMRRAEALDPGNIYVRIARLGLRPYIGSWRAAEQVLRPALVSHPGNPLLTGSLAGTMMSVGRCRDAATLLDGLAGKVPPTPGIAYTYAQTLWGAGRLDDADRAIGEAYALFPTHFAVWFTRFYFMLYTGRAEQSLAMYENVDGRPAAISDSNFAMIVAVARAMLSRKEADIDEAMRLNLAGARIASGYAENTIQFASALGRLDAAFEVVNAYFFERGFKTSDQRFPEQRTYNSRINRRTHFIFLPSTAAMRADPRFEALVGELGLTKYWREAGILPDYKRA
ncbi:winged helix-turn-helix domain-containing protein [Sphingomonas sp. G-3-2-10]|uniref:winged helix-turn-helix domain-containing protein n=1 Tax=Sphingomonas sp. G-3-2-10 TaxID=2728838 RepID=UPI00146BFAE1|nr:winged helix-turn-helix domain-containing protein [Sphingomonas sp. G-3-2-10]NML06962.1 hypothetical protein [Sphingomonas sp. G-3-2-10]